jgi:hypothetical protein
VKTSYTELEIGLVVNINVIVLAIINLDVKLEDTIDKVKLFIVLLLLVYHMVEDTSTLPQERKM